MLLKACYECFKRGIVPAAFEKCINCILALKNAKINWILLPEAK